MEEPIKSNGSTENHERRMALQTKATVAASALRQFGERWIGVRVSPFATLPHSSKGGLD
ncbi:hypothetical protein DAPPUDRAFT_244890 [Daphnia pulex]|uniref:Uncharacterized protein n=1 Tax=Daphnia pulex TaxID=6669 RepID=E9GM30_DAPPU|nr:hypothetical protein DAPPUDRAFT_244890 [Daphnia pulex]|eukprot:EFX79460.1 hypothetical protein DAPPUDRAFT_244890 [Daphnia pulex]